MVPEGPLASLRPQLPTDPPSLHQHAAIPGGPLICCTGPQFRRCGTRADAGSKTRHLSIPTIEPSGCHRGAAVLLTSTWSFSAAYAPPQISIPSGERKTAQALTWVIAAEPSGTLVDETTGAEVSYLFWEVT